MIADRTSVLRSGNTFLQNLRERVDSELEQSLVRVAYIGICSVLIVAGAFDVPFGKGTAVVMTASWSYWLLHLFHLCLRPQDAVARRVVAAVLDQVLILAFLYICGPATAPMTFMSATVSAGFGLRFGSGYAVLSALVGGIGLVVVAFLDRTWMLDMNWLLAVVLLVAVVPLYTAYLGRRLEKQRAEAEVEVRRLGYLATHDPLTGLANRALFIAQLERAIGACSRSGMALAVLFVDLDQFKSVNDRLGHDAGDDLLRRIANKLSDSVRSYDVVARLGGDEFLVLFDRLRDPGEVGPMVEALEERLREALNDAEASIGASASIGAAVHQPSDAPVPAEALIKRADTAMYAVKATRRNSRLAIVHTTKQPARALSR